MPRSCSALVLTLALASCNATTVLNATFEDDAPGSTPATDLPGDPDGDTLVVGETAIVQVLTHPQANSHALRVPREEGTVEMTAHTVALGTGFTPQGNVRIHLNLTMEAPATVPLHITAKTNQDATLSGVVWQNGVLSSTRKNKFIADMPPGVWHGVIWNLDYGNKEERFLIWGDDDSLYEVTLPWKNIAQLAGPGKPQGMRNLEFDFEDNPTGSAAFQIEGLTVFYDK